MVTSSMNTHIVRPATKQDCFAIAKLYSISSDGVADYIWTKLANDNEAILDVGRKRYERENTDFSYQNCTVVEKQGEVIGMLLAFPIFVDPDYHEDDPVLAPYFELEDDNSYYISGIALFAEHRGQGIGSELLRLAEQHAQAKGFTKLSLIVFEANSRAKDLYISLGYHEIKRAGIYPHPLIHYTGDAILMRKSLS